MNRILIIAICAGVLLAGLPSWASAQTDVLVVGLASAQLQWDIPVHDEWSAPERYVATCTSPNQPGPATGSVLHPQNMMPLVDLLPGRGTYTCTVRAENAAGASEESNEAVAKIVGPPGVVGNVRIEVR